MWSNSYWSKYDTDKNGSLSQSEMAAHPPLEQCLSRCRRDQGDEISAQQLTKNLEAIFDPSEAPWSAPIAWSGATGSRYPARRCDSFRCPSCRNVLPIGSGVTDSDGAAMISPPPRGTAQPKRRTFAGLMPPGLYLVEITHPTTKIPEKYNRKTVLGREVSSETVYRGDLAVDLKI